MRRHAALLLLTLVIGSGGCGWLLHKPRPDADRPLEQRPWRVRCTWVTEAAQQPSDPPGPRANGWAWAADAENRRLIVNGALEDGFLRVDTIRAASDTDDRDVVTIPVSSATVGDLCTETVRRLNLEPPPDAYGMAAVRAGGGAEVTMAFPFDPQGNLITRMVIFGDSLSDPGNLKQRLKIFPASPYWIGRFSNGPNWADLLGRSTGIAVQNHAFGGAVAVPHDEVPITNVSAPSSKARSSS
jgi:hypothetical protein